jgi:hypothetical protein
VNNEEDIDKLMSSSIKEIRDDKKEINIYKPNFRKTNKHEDKH